MWGLLFTQYIFDHGNVTIRISEQLYDTEFWCFVSFNRLLETPVGVLLASISARGDYNSLTSDIFETNLAKCLITLIISNQIYRMSDQLK